MWIVGFWLKKKVFVPWSRYFSFQFRPSDPTVSCSSWSLSSWELVIETSMMEVDSAAAGSSAALPLPDAAASSPAALPVPNGIPGVIAAVQDPLHFGGQQVGQQVVIPGFQNGVVALQPNGVQTVGSQLGTVDLGNPAEQCVWNSWSSSRG